MARSAFVGGVASGLVQVPFVVQARPDPRIRRFALIEAGSPSANQ